MQQKGKARHRQTFPFTSYQTQQFTEQTFQNNGQITSFRCTILLGATFDGRRFALCGGTVTLR